MKYLFNEKITHYNRLKGDDKHAQKDLSLLLELQPKLKINPSWVRFPERYAKQILYLLLDYASAEDILKNRNGKQPDKKNDPDKELKETQAELEETKDTLEDVQIELEETKEALQEAQLQADEAEERASEAKARLEAEKKKGK